MGDTKNFEVINPERYYIPQFMEMELVAIEFTYTDKRRPDLGERSIKQIFVERVWLGNNFARMDAVEQFFRQAKELGYEIEETSYIHRKIMKLYMPAVVEFIVESWMEEDGEEVVEL